MNFKNSCMSLQRDAERSDVGSLGVGAGITNTVNADVWRLCVNVASYDFSVPRANVGPVDKVIAKGAVSQRWPHTLYMWIISTSAKKCRRFAGSCDMAWATPTPQ